MNPKRLAKKKKKFIYTVKEIANNTDGYQTNVTDMLVINLIIIKIFKNKLLVGLFILHKIYIVGDFL